jgi:hypothetical protein
MPMLKHITKYAAPAETEKEFRKGDGDALRKREGKRHAVVESLTRRNLEFAMMPTGRRCRRISVLETTDALLASSSQPEYPGIERLSLVETVALESSGCW